MDRNRDGALDLIARFTDGRLMLYPGNGSGVFLASRQIGSGWQDMRTWTPVQQSVNGYPAVVATDMAGIMSYTRSMDLTKVLILLDVDGVLNPQVISQRLVVNPSRAALVAQLSGFGSVVWATSWSGAHVYHLTRDLELPSDTAAIAFPSNLHVDPRNPAPTPKLHWVARWVNRTLLGEATPSTAVVWIDDQLRGDATEWARTEPRPTLLVKPDVTVGLTEGHVATVRDFLTSPATFRNKVPSH